MDQHAMTCEQHAEAKTLATAQALLALLGAICKPLVTGGYIVTCGGYSRTFGDLDTLAALAANPGVR